MLIHLQNITVLTGLDIAESIFQTSAQKSPTISERKNKITKEVLL